MRRILSDYDYSKAGVYMLTLRVVRGVWLCRITPETFTLTQVGSIVDAAIQAMPSFTPELSVGRYQIMPDHVHMIVHVRRDLPQGKTLQGVIRGFKLGIDRSMRSLTPACGLCVPTRIFEPGLYDVVICTKEHLQKEEAYVLDNVRRYRLKKGCSEFFTHEDRLLSPLLPTGYMYSSIGNRFLLERPRIERIQFSRSTTEEEWSAVSQDIAWNIHQGVVFISPFISPFEKRAFRLIMDEGGACIYVRKGHRVENRYKPGGKMFDYCSEGRFLQINVAPIGAEIHAMKADELSREDCLMLNQICEFVWAHRAHTQE